MEKRIFKTILKDDHELIDNEYVLGRISGIKLAMCDKDPTKGFIWEHICGVGHMLKTECTSDQYDAFTKIIEELYPGFCIFDYKE